MLQEVIDLQQRAVGELFRLACTGKKEITFRAPTGSGKTRMMADFHEQNVDCKGRLCIYCVFIVER